MAERPAIQLYFGDFEGNEKVKRCSWGARGALLYVMGLLHRSDEYGVLRWPLKEIAGAIGAPFPLVKEIATKGALKGSDTRVQAYRWAPSHAGRRGPEIVLIQEQDGPLWYSSRMVRDEYKRTNRGITTRFGEGGKLPTGAPDPTPSGTPSQRIGDGNGSPHEPPTRREGDGASASSSIPNVVRTESPTEVAPAAATAKVNGGPKDWPEIKGTAWRRNPDLAARKANSIGLQAHAGESLDQLVRRIDVAEAQAARARA